MCENMNVVFHPIDPIEMTVFVFEKTQDECEQFRPSIF
ncbi:hypothetical protein A33Q_2389 [Indibacter alkaliphilus LW1]|uniref:Uncharacterized protein n=1 Tax=Indibacter alkaliphilus (strain CCUG 57479 / KCTC 22604 / LW1) TaxID=1189612 RepID=S2DCJ3_INDAL|nr:hypothetical protein A33Q_2389 [Indibacter alkaliphilus LW1]